MAETSIGTKKEKRKNAEVSITGVLPKEYVAKEVDKTLLRIQGEMELPGFRRGKAPLERVRAEVGEKALWREAAEAALKKELGGILKQEEVLPIMPVAASLKASDPDTDVSFEIIAAIAPTCVVGNYKEIAEGAMKKVADVDIVKEKERALSSLRQQARAMIKAAGEGELTLDEAMGLGFENVKAAEHFLMSESERGVREKMLQTKRAAIAETLIEKSECDIPRAMVMEEARALLEATKKDVARHETPWNEYVKKIGKTEEEIQKELEVPAEKRVALDLVFSEIAKAENIIEGSHEDEERLLKTLTSQGVDEESARRYLKTVLIREKIWEALGAKSESRG